jgi:hypothetical protein
MSRLRAAIASIMDTLKPPAGAFEQNSETKRYVKARKLNGEQAKCGNSEHNRYANAAGRRV